MKKRKSSLTASRRSPSKRATSRLLAGLNRDASALGGGGDPLLDVRAAAIFRALASAMDLDCERAGTRAGGRMSAEAMVRAHLRRLAFTAGVYRTKSLRR